MLRVLIGVFLGLVLAETQVRLLSPQDLLSYFSWYKAHPVYQFRHRANLDRLARWKNIYRIRTNSKGLREDKEIQYDPGNNWRVVVHGDSQTFGVGINGENTFVAVAAKKLKNISNKIELINLGVSGHGPGLEYLYFREEGKKYKPKVTVVSVFPGNDITDVFKHNALKIVNGRLELRPYKISFLKKLSDSTIYKFVSNNSHLLILLRNAWISRMPRDDRKIVSEIRKDSGSHKTYINKSLFIWGEFIKEIKKQKSIPFFLILPSRAQCVVAKGGVPGENQFPIADPGRRELVKYLAQMKVIYIDILSAMKNEKGSCRYFIGGEDIHYNERGHRIIGRELAKKLGVLYSNRINKPGDT